jgi:hypothetical protein
VNKASWRRQGLYTSSHRQDTETRWGQTPCRHRARSTTWASSPGNKPGWRKQRPCVSAKEKASAPEHASTPRTVHDPGLMYGGQGWLAGWRKQRPCSSRHRRGSLNDPAAAYPPAHHRHNINISSIFSLVPRIPVNGDKDTTTRGFAVTSAEPPTLASKSPPDPAQTRADITTADATASAARSGGEIRRCESRVGSLLFKSSCKPDCACGRNRGGR